MKVLIKYEENVLEVRFNFIVFLELDFLNFNFYIF